MKTKLLNIPIALVIALTLSACGDPAEPEQTLEERVMARWQHMIDRDFAAAWNYYAPGFRETNPVEAFVSDMKRRPIRWHEAEFLGSDCNEMRCDVQLRVVYQAIGAPSGLGSMRVPRLLSERWIAVDGEWWYSG